MQQWEYTTFTVYEKLDFVHKRDGKEIKNWRKKALIPVMALTELGEKGWELVSVYRGVHYFKRPKE